MKKIIEEMRQQIIDIYIKEHPRYNDYVEAKKQLDELEKMINDVESTDIQISVNIANKDNDENKVITIPIQYYYLERNWVEKYMPEVNTKLKEYKELYDNLHKEIYNYSRNKYLELLLENNGKRKMTQELRRIMDILTRS